MAKRNRPATYEAEHKGRKVRVAVPDAVDEGELFAGLQDNLSPEAVAAIAAYLQPVATNNAAVNRQVAWFRDRLVELLGASQFDVLCNDLGL